MRMMRVSIAGLMGFVLVAALGFAGLKGATEYWASGCFTLMVAAMTLAILLAMQGRGRDRAYWSGFAVAGWAYFALNFGVNEASRAACPPLLTQILFNRIVPLIHPESVVSGSFTFGPTLISSGVMPPPAPPAPPAPPVVALAPAPPPAPSASASAGVILDETITATTSPSPPPSVVPTPIAPPAQKVMWLAPPVFPTMPVNGPLVHGSQVAHSLTALVAGMLGGFVSAWLFARRERREAAPIDQVSPSSP